MRNDPNWLLFVAYSSVLVPFLLFVIFYAAKSPWRATAPGRALMILACTLNLVLTNSLLTIALGAYWGQPAVRIVVIGSSFISGWYLLITLLRLQNRGSDRQDELEVQRASDTRERREVKAMRRQAAEAKRAARELDKP